MNKAKARLVVMYAVIIALGTSTGVLWANNSMHKDLLSEATSVIKEKEKQIVVLDKEAIKITNEKNEVHQLNIKLSKEVKDLEKILDDEYNKKLEEKKKESVASKRTIDLEATAYTAFCSSGCIGITATGKDVSNTVYHEGRRVVAVDPDVIPLYTIMEIQYPDGRKEEVIALDTGGAIQGYRLDILVKTKQKAVNFGRQDVTVKVIKWG